MRLAVFSTFHCDCSPKCDIMVEELEFPSSLTANERAYIHRLAAAHNLKSKSKG